MIKHLKIIIAFNILTIVLYPQSKSIERISKITYLGDGVAKYEMVLEILPQYDYFIASDAIETSAIPYNIQVLSNNTHVDSQNYQVHFDQYSNKLYIAQIILRSMVSVKTFQEIKIMFDFHVWHYLGIRSGNVGQLQLKMAEAELYSKPALNVKYRLKLCTMDSLFLPSAELLNSEYLVEKYAKEVDLTKNYYSNDEKSKNNFYFIGGLLYTNYNLIPIQEYNEVITVKDDKLIDENISEKIIGLNRGTLAFMYKSTFPHYFHIVSEPKITLNINGINRNMMRVPSDSITIYNYRKFNSSKKYLFSWGDEFNKDGKVLRVIFLLNRNDISFLEINFTHTWMDQVSSEDGFHFVFDHGSLSSYSSAKKDLEYVTIKVPSNFIITKFPFQEFVQNKLDNIIFYKFNKISEHSDHNMIIHFQRIETEVYDILKVLNLFIVILSILVYLYYALIRKKGLNNNIYGIFYVFLTVLNGIILSWISNKWFSIEYLKNAFLYTYAYLPFLLSLIIFLIKDKIKTLPYNAV